ncbi:MAG: 4Fe-4S binding protein [Spirochaetales bacterium]
MIKSKKNDKKSPVFSGAHIRHIIQGFITLITNSYIVGFFSAKIFTGKTKYVCVPGLNCYSCPGALSSCPIGAYQAVVGGRTHNITYYVTGILIFFGVLFGRVVCGFLCPMGFLQDLLYKIPLPRHKTQKEKAKRFKIPQIIDKPLRYLKYIMLIVPVMLLPIIFTRFGIGDPYFCKWICPVGTLEGGIPLVLQNESLQAMVGFLFTWKMTILAIIIISSIFIYRPFCKYICPLGAIYALFNSVSIYNMSIDNASCTRCGLCEKACHMQVEIIKKLRTPQTQKPQKKSCAVTPISSPECIRCGDCKRACPHNAIKSGWGR